MSALTDLIPIPAHWYLVCPHALTILHDVCNFALFKHGSSWPRVQIGPEVTIRSQVQSESQPMLRPSDQQITYFCTSTNDVSKLMVKQSRKSEVIVRPPLILHELGRPEIPSPTHATTRYEHCSLHLRANSATHDSSKECDQFWVS